MRIKERFKSATVGAMFGASDLCGIATVLSGTTVASVTCATVNSGDVIIASIIQHAGARTYNGSSFIGTAVGSVRAGAFEIFTVGSKAVINDMPVAWMVIRR